jgi:hypothetical protein
MHGILFKVMSKALGGPGIHFVCHGVTPRPCEGVLETHEFACMCACVHPQTGHLGFVQFVVLPEAEFDD